MTIQGAVNELISLLNADDIPIYYKGGIKKVIETIDDYIDGKDDYVKRKTEPTAKDIYYEAEGHCEFKCSRCGAEIGVVEGGDLDGAVDFKFCPNCGARLIKDEPQWDVDKGTIKCDNCSENGSYKCSKCDGEMYFKRLAVKDEPQTERSE